MRPMNRSRLLRWATAVVALYGVIWIAPEGDLVRVVLLGTGVTLVTVGHLAQRLPHHDLTGPRRLLAAAALGLLVGAGVPLVTLALMALKTGLHAHGPEFTVAEISWVASRLPWWAAGGGLAGLGAALLLEGSGSRG